MDYESKKKSCCPFNSFSTFFKWLYPYALMMWDGNTFFGTDDTKLKRLDGHPVTFFCKFHSPRWILITFGSLIFTIVILSIEISKFGKVKSKEI